jgi:hypothetical protein
MKSHRVYEFSALLAFLAVLLFLCFSVRPLRAEEPTPKESVAKELQTKEVKPEEPRVYSGDSREYADGLILIAEFDVAYTRSDLSGSNAIGGADINGLFAPTYKFNDRNFLILMYDGQYYKKREFYSDEIGYKERTEFQGHTITPMYEMDFGERTRYSIMPSLFYTTTYNIDNEASGWRDGLYNYRDRGAGLDFDMRELFGENGTLKLGAQYYTRRYPNYASLLSLTGLDSIQGYKTEENEKDYHGVIARAGYNWIQESGFSWGMEYSVLYKKLDDKKVIDENGMPSSEDQRDSLQSLDFGFWYMFDIDGGLKLGLDLNDSINNSNQDYYEIVGPGPLDYELTHGFYDYNSYRITPNASYTFALFPLTTGLSYAYEKTDYSNRRAKFSDGLYKDDKHWEILQEINLDFRYDLLEDWSVFAQWQWIDARSNNDDERVYQYDYTANSYSVGVSYKY